MGDDRDLPERFAAAGAEPDDVDAALQRRRLMAALFEDDLPPPTIGRYRVVRVVGQGGMGTVYEALDPQLGRPVAIKVLNDRRDPDRLLTEGQAMARVVHPNAVPVFDFGVVGDRLFIAMELVVGVTARRWLEEPRTWEDVLDAFIAAGEGLAAVHAAGLLHRDFKPDNILVGDDGRTRVTDFGLALARPTVDPDAGVPTPTIQGTPGYMSPEQARGEAVDERADIYSFCVALHEALSGERPAEDGAGEHPPAGVPPWLNAVVARGLAPARSDRWPSMRALVDALRQPPRVRRRWAWAAAVAIASIPLAVMVAQRTPADPDDASAASQVDPGSLTRRIEQAESMRVAGRYDDAANALRQVFDAAVAGNAPEVAARAATELVFVEGYLLENGEGGDDWARHARAQLERLSEPAAIEGRLHRNLGILRQEQRRTAEAARHFQLALELNLQRHGPGHLDVGHAYENLATLSYETGHFESARTNYLRALAILEEVLGVDDPAVAVVLDDLGNVEEELGNDEAARRLYMRGLEIRQRLPENHPQRAGSWANLGTLSRRAGDLEAAATYHRRALELRERVLGVDHPDVAVSLADLGEVAQARGDVDAALRLYSRARVISESAHGPEHVLNRRILGHLAQLDADPTQ